MPAKGIERLPETFCQHDFQGSRVFQHRTRDKWNFFGENKAIPGFLHEAECRVYLDELRREWDGRIKTSPFEKALRSKRVRQVYDALVNNVFDYHQVSFGHRPMRFLRDGRIGEGNGSCEVSWALVEKAGDVMLEIHSEREITCRLTQNGDGKWKGRWFYHEKKAVELIVLPSV